MDAQLVEKIVHEVKSQGVFDEFRRDVMADVDTKPAYQNLRQRVEVSVKKFLSEQRWTPEMNKNQLRERLRRHITETRANFLDVGVERIVDQVVNPKIDSVFQPRIEEITYKYLGLTPPPPLPPTQYEPPPLMHPVFPPLPINGGPSSILKVETMTPVAGLLPTDLEQVSPDSDKATVKSEFKDESMTEAAEYDVDMEIEEKADDEYESPPFEPLKREVELRDSDMDTSDSPEPPPLNEDTNTSSQLQNQQQQDNETQDTTISVNTNAEHESSDKEAAASRTHFLDVAETPVDTAAVASAYGAPEESQLSQVSSDSRISAAESRDFQEDNNTEQTQKSQSSGGGGGGNGDGNVVPTNAAVNISEEAQMPKFSENSSSEAANGGEEGVNGQLDQSGPQLHFDIKKDEIKFEGTERKTSLLPDASNEGEGEGGTSHDGGGDKAENIQNNSSNNCSDQKNSETAEPNATFHFSATTGLNSATEVIEVAATTDILPTTQDSSFGSSLDDTNSMQLGASSGGGTEEKAKGDAAVAEQAAVVATSNETNSTKHSSETTTKHISSSANSSSSSSRHKKHSKDKQRRRSHEKDRHRSSKSGGGGGGGGGESGKSRSGDKEKDKERSKDKDKEKEKEKDRHHSSHSRSKHSSSSSSNAKHSRTSSSHSKTSTPSNHKSENPVDSKSGQQETKRERERDRKRDGSSSDKHRHSSSSTANSNKEHSKPRRKTPPPPSIDDHNESKEKSHWRHSTDSDDEDASPGSGGKPSSANRSAGGNEHSDNKSNTSSSNSKTKSKNGNGEVNGKSTQNDAVADEKVTKDSATPTSQPPRSNKVILLNDILQNPATNFIALESTLTNTQTNHVQIVSSCSSTSTPHTQCPTTSAPTSPPSPPDLLFFEENNNQFAERLRLLDNAMDRCRKVVNSLRFDTMPTPQEELEENEAAADDDEEVFEKNNSQLQGKIHENIAGGTINAQPSDTLLIDCGRYDDDDADFDQRSRCEESAPLPPKRFRSNDGTSKASPTPSDTSLNSKENEAFDKNMVESSLTKKTCVRRRSINAVQKLSQQQRYTSEDLYKPRPILSQRSRRRGVDSVI